MNERKKLIHEVYGEIKKRCFAGEDVIGMIESCTSKFGKSYVCELSTEELEEVMEDLRGVKNG